MIGPKFEVLMPSVGQLLIADPDGLPIEVRQRRVAAGGETA